MEIYSITPFTLLDYPHKSSCILWYAGCNMRCVYCYNPEIVLGKAKIAFSEAVSFLEKRRGLLDAVVFSGGECLVHKHITDQIRFVKSMGFLVKVDTNGSRPEVLKQLISEDLVDYVAIDFKSTSGKTKTITRKQFYPEFITCLQMLISSGTAFEVRTTYHSALLDSSDITEMIALLESCQYRGRFYIQYFRNGVEILGDLPRSVPNLDSEMLSTTNIKVVIR